MKFAVLIHSGNCHLAIESLSDIGGSDVAPGISPEQF